jgi:hypothetical protein
MHVNVNLSAWEIEANFEMQKKDEGEDFYFSETNASKTTKSEEDLCVLLIIEGKLNRKIVRSYESNQDSTWLHKNRIIWVLLIAEGKHNRKITRFYDLNRDFDNHESYIITYYTLDWTCDQCQTSTQHLCINLNYYLYRHVNVRDVSCPARHLPKIPTHAVTFNYINFLKLSNIAV